MGLFFTRAVEQKILNEIEVKDSQGNTVSKTENEPLADDANKDTNDGFGTDPDNGYANRGGEGGGSSSGGDDAGGEEPVPDDSGGGEEPVPDDSGGDYTVPDEGGEEPVPDEGSEEPMPDDGGGEEPVPDGDSGEAPLPDGDTGGGEEPVPDDSGGGEEPVPDEGGEEPVPDEEGEEGSEDEEDGGAETDKSLDDQIKEVEKELFANINADQMKEKIYRLKKDYIDLYETIVKLGEDLIKIPRNSNTQIVLDFLNKKVAELKELVSYNMLHNFDNKTYIENTITYQECLAALNSISSILEELESTYNVEEDEEDSDKDNE